MSKNVKRMINWLVFAAGLILGIIGWATDAYSSWTGTIIFLCALAISIALRILWGLEKKENK